MLCAVRREADLETIVLGDVCTLSKVQFFLFFRLSKFKDWNAPSAIENGRVALSKAIGANKMDISLVSLEIFAQMLKLYVLFGYNVRVDSILPIRLCKHN